MTTTTPVRRMTLHPPLLNSSSPWATTFEHLSALFSSPYTGAITTRTSLPGPTGFPHDPTIHQYTFLPPPAQSQPPPRIVSSLTTSRHPETIPHPSSPAPIPGSGAINTFGYSPHPLSYYLSLLPKLPPPPPEVPIKPVIISITGTTEEISTCLSHISRAGHPAHMPLWVEINLSCPNIPNHPPPAYDGQALKKYIEAVASWRSEVRNKLVAREMKIGIKTPPYTYLAQFCAIVDALAMFPEAIDFVTACNTLGTSLSFLASREGEEIRRDYLLGGLSGPSLHPLALGNVCTLRKLLDEYRDKDLSGVVVIGVGGVCDKATFEGMRRAGADFVGVGVGLGVGVESLGTGKGVESVFRGILEGG